MRLTLELAESCPTKIPNRKILYFVGPKVLTVQALIEKLKADLKLETLPILSVDDYVVFPKCPIQILREDDLIKVSVKVDSTSSDSTRDSSSSEEESAKESSAENQGSDRSSSESDSSESDEDSSSSESTDSKSENRSSHTSEAVNKNEAALPEIPDASWKVVQKPPTVGKVLMYKILQVSEKWQPEVSPWRFGKVLSVLDIKKGDGCTIRLIPWPDASGHPDPTLVYEPSSSSDDEDEDEEKKSKPRILEAPKSEYQEDGCLTKKLRDFVEVRCVDATTVMQFENGTPVREDFKRKQPVANEDTLESNHCPKIARKGVAGVLRYLRDERHT